MSMRMAPEAGASLSNHHAPPPAPMAAAESYSSNYKGVMLCDRPGIEVSRDIGGGGGSAHAPFLSAVSAPEQLGLNPIKKEHLNSGKGTKQPKNVVLSNHKRWLHSLQMLKRQLADEEAYLATEEEDKKTRLAEESKKVRDQIRQIKSAMVDPADVDGFGAEGAAMNKEGMLSELRGQFGRDVVGQVLDRTAVAQCDDAPTTNDAPAPETRRNKSAGKAKPAWARTEEEEAEAEEDEVEDLLEFAENLDIDKYMDDYEFKEALAAAKARITELDEDVDEAEAGDDCQTVGSAATHTTSMTQRLRARADQEENGGDEDWDGRTNASHESGRSRVSMRSRAVAQEMLEMNPNLRKMHSARSLAEVVENMDQPGFDPQDQQKFGRCGMGAVKVAVHNDEDRLHRMDVKEGKDLPYLYRNPAV